ncbi:hypothetical protein C8A05DRAFT_17951 [Staphylotrichum tortipilum]|uniref:F-box domain-containing protein n=1 Tax=Staphylotrichum tortipilum TaxID=2831512 RepID=A0AAN6RRN3_9PEZI|nr:hypothetical protein C8A05DRAFT_17951 [Staphylotrichum longicolle]
MLASGESLGTERAPACQARAIKPALLISHVSDSSRGTHPQTADSSPGVTGESHLAPDGSITLETLPAELRLHILRFVSQLGDLKALVRASPVFHQQYLLDRQHLLGNALRTTLGTVLVDAQALQRSIGLPDVGLVPLATTKQLVEQQLVEYGALRGDPDAALDMCCLVDLISISSFYLSVIQALLVGLPPLLLSDLGGPPDLKELSRTERTRWTRALYRVQLFYSLFRFDDPLEVAELQFSETDKIVMFFGIFDPWENEEIYSVYQAIGHKYARVLEEIPWDLRKYNTTMHESSEPGSFNLDKCRYPIPCLWTTHTLTLLPRRTDTRNQLKEGTIATGGLDLFRRVLAAADHDELANLMEANLAWCTVDTIANMMDWFAQDMAREEAPSERDEAEFRSDKMPFIGDREDAPPLAWVILWRGLYSNTYGDSIPAPLRNFGYVLWDAERLERTGGRRRVEAHSG